MNFRSFEDMNVSIVNVLDKIRQYDIDLVVGIPRSGIAPAAFIALHLQLPYADLQTYINRQASGTSGKRIDLKAKNRVLLVDDSINTGSSFKKSISLIKAANIEDELIKFAVWYSDKTNLSEIDLCADFCPRPRVFQWNLWKHHKLGRFGTDMDGVLCRDPSKKENDKGPKLLDFYHRAEPKFLPERPVKFVITSRLEKYRDVTTDWLKRHNIQYEKLIMKTDSNIKHGLYKANIINSNNMLMYIESDPKQAKQISERVNIPVWCTDNQKIYKKDA
jgi:hypoxanthine phosphoribosyltransferase/uncharacterized HAD superfamily protein